MRIAVISDIHDNLANLEKFLGWCGKEKIAWLICLGDITNAETLEALARFPGEIDLVAGNGEIYDAIELARHPRIRYHGLIGAAAVDGQKIGFCHEPYLIDEILRKESDLDFVFYGHTHKPWEIIDKNRPRPRIINPGTLGGVFQKATFAVYCPTEDGIELKILELL
jgi:putative phosphoesterase